VRAPYIVKYHNNASFRQFLVLLSGDSAEFDVQKLAIRHINRKSYQHKDSKNKKMSIFAFALNDNL
jgi:hypothetical protein